MSEATAVAPGMPLPLDTEVIEREISQLWKVEGGPAGDKSPVLTHVCLSNLILYLPDERSRSLARDLLPGVGRRFPSRMLLLGLKETPAGEPPLTARLNAICHRASPSVPPVCCEQIFLEAASPSLFPGAVLPLLVPDVPVILVIFTSGCLEVFDLLEDVVDRVVFDSRELSVSELRRTRDLRHRCPDLEVDDLAWRDTAWWRKGLCEIFEDSRALRFLEGLESVEVEYQPPAASRSPGGAMGGARAALLAGWLASRLGFRPAGAAPPAGSSGAGASAGSGAGAGAGAGSGAARLVRSDGRSLAVSLRPIEAPASEMGRISTVRLIGAEGSSLVVRRQGDLEALEIDARLPQDAGIPRRLRYPSGSDSDILGSILERPADRAVVDSALEIACSLSGEGQGEALVILPSPEDVARAAGRALREACTSRERVCIALSGGSTPALLYRHLAGELRPMIPWERLEIFFSDERAVPKDHADSNYRLASELLLSRVPVPPQCIHRLPGEEADLEAAARRYEEAIRRIVPAGKDGLPAFDLVWLGMGADGHTASLFPGSSALRETARLVVSTDVVAPADGPRCRRLTFTLPLLNAARRVQFLVAGKKKSEAVRRVAAGLAGAPVGKALPAVQVRPAHGILEWILDREAAAELGV